MGLTPKTVYECPVCRTTHETLEGDSDCIITHDYPTSIIDAWGEDPKKTDACQYIRVRTESGAVHQYKWSYEVKEG